MSNPIRWSDNRPPCDACRYDHTVADNEAGQAVVMWRGWAPDPTYTVLLNAMIVGMVHTLDDAKRLAENLMRK